MWSAVTKASIAEAVLALTKLDEDRRRPTDCLQIPSLWLTLAALCLLQDEHVERLSSTTLYRGAVNKVRSLSEKNINIIFTFLLNSSRSVPITMMEKQEPKSFAPSVDHFASTATEFYIFLENSGLISVR